MAQRSWERIRVPTGYPELSVPSVRGLVHSPESLGGSLPHQFIRIILQLGYGDCERPCCLAIVAEGLCCMPTHVRVLICEQCCQLCGILGDDLCWHFAKRLSSLAPNLVVWILEQGCRVCRTAHSAHGAQGLERMFPQHVIV